MGKQKAPAAKKVGRPKAAAATLKEKEKDTTAAAGEEKAKARAAQAEVLTRSTLWELGVATNTGKSNHVETTHGEVITLGRSPL